MLHEVKILEEGHEYTDGRIISPEAIVWERDPIPVLELFTQEWLGGVFNLRRKGNVLFGDINVEIELDSVTPYLVKTKVVQDEKHTTFIQATLACVYVEKIRRSQFLQAP